MSNTAHVWIDRQQIHHRSDEDFDRLAFACRALRLVASSHLRVAVCEGVSTVKIERGRDYRLGPDQFWGMLSIPPHASKAEIALAIASLTGNEKLPYVVTVLMQAGDGTS